MRAEYSRLIHGRPEEVWPYFFEEEKMKTYMDELEEFVNVNEMEDGVGAMYRMVLGSGKAANTFRAVAMEWEENAKLAYDISGGPFKDAHMRMTFELQPEGDLTKVTCSNSIDQKKLGFIAKMAMSKVVKGSEQQFEKQLTALDRHLRSEHATA